MDEPPLWRFPSNLPFVNRGRRELAVGRMVPRQMQRGAACRAPSFFLSMLATRAGPDWRGRGSRSRCRQGDVRGQPRRHHQAVACAVAAAARLGAGVGAVHGGAGGRPQARFAQRRARAGAERAGRSPRRRDPWRGGAARARVRCANRATAAWGGGHVRPTRADARPPMAVFHCSGNPMRSVSQANCRRVPGTPGAARFRRGQAATVTSWGTAPAQAMLWCDSAGFGICVACPPARMRRGRGARMPTGGDKAEQRGLFRRGHQYAARRKIAWRDPTHRFSHAMRFSGGFVGGLTAGAAQD